MARKLPPGFVEILRQVNAEATLPFKHRMKEAWRRYKTQSKRYAMRKTINPRKKKGYRRCPGCGGLFRGKICPVCITNPKQNKHKYAPYNLSQYTNEPKFRHQRLRSPKKLYHMRTVTAGEHRVIVGCPIKHKGRCPVPTVAQAILHPKKETENPIAIYNPNIETRIPATSIAISYRRSSGDYIGKWFRHSFGKTVSMYGLDNGAIMLRSNQRKKLWGSVD